MGLTSSIDIAASGLRATQAGMAVVSQNVANSGSVGYTRRTLVSSQAVSGNQTTGVDVSGAQRLLDTLVQRQLRLEQAGASYTGVRASYASSLDGILDTTGGSGTLPTLVNGLTSALQNLVNDPSSNINRTSTLAAASDLASTLNSLSGQVQGLRQNAETALGQDVTTANGLLQQIASVNSRMVADPANASSAALQDQRDGLIDQLSQYMDLKVTPSANGSVTIATTGGLQLFDGVTATKLAFDTHPSIGAASTYSTDPSQRSVGTITATDASGRSIDALANGMIRSGEIAGLVEVRDQTLPRAQTQLDSLAAGLASSLSDKSVQGTPAASGAATGYDLDLSGLSNGNSFKVSVTGPGSAARTLTFVKTADAASAAAATASGGGAVGLDFSGGPASVAAQVQAALGTGFAASSPSGTTLRILDDGAAGTTDVTALTGSATVTGLSSGDPELPLFVDGNGSRPYTGSYDGGASQLTGLASRIAVNPALAADSSKLVAYSASTAAGDATRPSLILDRLTTASLTFSGAAGIGGSSAPYSGTVVDFANQIVATQASDANSAASLNDGQQVVLNAIQSRYSDQAGVNIDTELTQLIQLQTAYGANARIMTAANDMMTMLLRIGQ